MKPKKSIITTIKTHKGDLIQIPWDKTSNEEQPEYPQGIIFKITRNARRDEPSSNDNNQKSGNKNEGEGESGYSSDSEDFNTVPHKMIPTVVYQTTNALFKDYMKYVDSDTHERLKSLEKKYLGRALFTVDKTEFKEQLKLKRREAKRLRK